MNLPPHLIQYYLGQAIKEHFEKVQRLESENLNLNDEIGYLQQKNEALHSECEGLAAQVESLEQDNVSMRDENERLEAENYYLQEEVSRILHTKTDENPFVDEYVFILKAQVESLKAQNSSHYQPQMDALRNRTNILRRLLDNLETDVNELQSAISGCDR